MHKKPKPKKCRACGTTFRPFITTAIACSTRCAMDIAEKKRIAKEAQEVRQERVRHREQKLALKTRREWLKEAQIEFNRYIRARDKKAGHPCISSGRPLDWSGNQVDSGHYRSLGSAPHLRFDEDNCHAQSKHDNQYKSGNVVEYRINLIKRIGLEQVEILEADQTVRKYTIEQLKIIKEKYKQMRKEIEREL